MVGEKIVVEGLLPRTGEKSYFTPENNLGTNEWFWKDIGEMMGYVRAEGERKGVQLGRVQEVLVDVIERESSISAISVADTLDVGP